MSNQTGQHQHAQHPALRNMFPPGANTHMNPAMHGALGFPGAYNPQMQFHAPQPPQQAYANMMGVSVNVSMQARMQQLHQAQQAQIAQAQAHAQAQAQAQTQAQTQQQNMQQGLGININGAGPSTNAAALNSHASNPAFASVNNNGGDIPEKHKQQLAALLQRTAQGGLRDSAQLTSAVAPHLPAILALAKAGRLDATQLAQLKTLVRVVTENKNRAAQQPGQQQNQGQRPGQGSPQVPAITPSFPNSPAAMGTPPQQPNHLHPHLANQQNATQSQAQAQAQHLQVPGSHLQPQTASSPHLRGQSPAQNQSQTMQNQLTQPPQTHLPTPQQLHFQSQQQLHAQNQIQSQLQTQQNHLPNQQHLQVPGSSATPPPQVAGVKRKAPPGTLTLPPNEVGQVQAQVQVNGINGAQMNGVGMMHQANGLGQPANGMQMNMMGQQPQQQGNNGQNVQQRNALAGQPQLGQPLAQLPAAARTSIMQRARILAAQQGRHDEQYVMGIAKAMVIKLRTDQVQAQAQAQAQALAAMGGQAQPQAPTQAAGPPGGTQQLGVAQAQAQTQQPPQSAPSLQQPQLQPQPQSQPQPQPQPQTQPQPQPQPPPQPQPQPQPQAQPQPQSQPQPQPPQQAPQAPQMAPSTSGQGQPTAQVPAGAPASDPPAASTPQPARPSLGPFMAQINVTQSGEASPVTSPTTLNPPTSASSSTTIAPSALNVTNPGPQPWPVSKNLKTFGSFRLGARPTLSQGLPGGPILGTPSQIIRFGAGDEALGLGIGEAETEEKEDAAGAGGSVVAKKAGPASGEPVGVGMSGRRTIQELVAELDPRVTVDTEMESYLLARADEFIDSVMHFACRIAKHRGSDQVEPRDIQLHLERNHNIRIPGFASDEIRGALNRPSVEVKPKNMGGTDKSKKKKLNPEAAASLRAARVAAVQNARGMGKD